MEWKIEKDGMENVKHGMENVKHRIKKQKQILFTTRFQVKKIFNFIK
jgi:hypothetical protein